MNEKNDVYFHHFRVHKDNRGPAVTVAFRKPKEGDAALRVGLAFCSPLDSFSRKRGRRIASGRLDKHPQLVGIRLGDRFPYRESIAQWDWDIDSKPHCPRWLSTGDGLEEDLMESAAYFTYNSFPISGAGSV